VALLLHKWLFLAYVALVHPLYVAVTEINHNAQEKTLEISCKTFADDLGKAIEKSANVKIDLFNIKDKAAAEKAITEYFRKHLVLKADGKAVQLELIGFERESEAVWSYFQVTNISSVKKLDVTNNILFEASNDQINLLHVTVNGNRKSTKLDFPNTHASFDF
jgi:uncharacterized protein DUF6702